MVFVVSASIPIFLSFQIEMKHEPNLLEYQLSAMEDLEVVPIHDNHWFNANGNINKGGTIQIDEYRCVIQLGFGRYRCD
ncbi:competence protein ComGD [Erysipelothrix sp. P66]|uniref:competence protein ComGD n=1 Tax=Erysipelothrix sp. P66 TaxID=3141531 RepID=UPI00315CE0EB